MSVLINLSHQYLDFLLNAERQNAIDLVLRAADQWPLEKIYIDILQEAQYEVGRMWERHEISIAQEHYCTAVTQLVMSLLYTRINQTPKTGRTFVGYCIERELHEVGLRMVCDLFELRGWQSFYLGTSLPADDIVNFARTRKPDAVGISATLSDNVDTVREIIARLRSELLSRTIILAGGQPFIADPQLWREVGADGCASSAVEAVEVAERFVAERGSST